MGVDTPKRQYRKSDRFNIRVEITKREREIEKCRREIFILRQAARIAQEDDDAKK